MATTKELVIVNVVNTAAGRGTDGWIAHSSECARTSPSY